MAQRLLTVTGQHLLAWCAEPGTIALQAAENSKHIAFIGSQLALTEPGHIRLTGGALLRRTLRQRRTFWRGRLRRKLRQRHNRAAKKPSERQTSGTDHSIPPSLPFYRARRASTDKTAALVGEAAKRRR
jgi:hypothetical protein